MSLDVDWTAKLRLKHARILEATKPTEEEIAMAKDKAKPKTRTPPKPQPPIRPGLPSRPK